LATPPGERVTERGGIIKGHGKNFTKQVGNSTRGPYKKQVKARVKGRKPLHGKSFSQGNERSGKCTLGKGFFKGGRELTEEVEERSSEKTYKGGWGRGPYRDNKKPTGGLSRRHSACYLARGTAEGPLTKGCVSSKAAKR